MRKIWFTSCTAFAFTLGLTASPPAPKQTDREVLEYVRAIRVQRDRVNYQVQVTISASIPSLAKTGILTAVKKQMAENAVYEGMNFQGDGMVKTNVIARYLTAESEQRRPEERLATEISPLNYKFTPKGTARLGDRDALVYDVKPLRKRVGLFRGTVWLDRETKLPLREEGKLEKLPSIWLKEVVFTRTYELVDGVSLPSRIHSEVKTRIVGRSIITVDFSNYHVADALVAVARPPAVAAGGVAEQH